MSFMPLTPCCLTGTLLPGTPRGIMESRSVNRYHAKPADGRVVDKEAAIIMFYDAGGFSYVC
jgi:hypothetical protein